MKAVALDNYTFKSDREDTEYFKYTKGKVYTFSITPLGVLINDDNKRANLMCKEEVNKKFKVVE